MDYATKFDYFFLKPCGFVFLILLILKITGIITGGSLMLVIIAALKNTEMQYKQVQINEGNIGLIKNLGKVLFTEYVFPFEISSVLFLSAMVGAVVIGKKD